MKEHPILFSSAMVRALLEGRKTQTRRVVKPQPKVELFPFIGSDNLPTGEFAFVDHPRVISKHIACPYGKPGDRLWVRETWAKCTGCNEGHGVIFRADETANAHKWKPSIFMPREFSRINLELNNIRVERVQEISNRDALAEGVTPQDSAAGWARMAYRELWDSINAKRGFGWDVNPWVWVLDFQKL